MARARTPSPRRWISVRRCCGHGGASKAVTIVPARTRSQLRIPHQRRRHPGCEPAPHDISSGR
jgi:hypothetical protein